MTAQTITTLADGLQRRWEVAKAIGCGQSTIGRLEEMWLAAVKIEVEIRKAKRARQEGAS